MSWVRAHSLYFAWMIALISVLGSIYYGEVLDMEPCRLCWYQRIGMFPLALFLGFAFYKNDLKVARYCLPLVIFGGVVAFYQGLSQIFPVLHLAALCGETSCTVSGILPYLSFLAFAVIFALIFFHPKEN